MGRRITRQEYARRAERSITLTTNPDPEQMIAETRKAAAESFAPVADQVIRSAIGAELRRAYENFTDDLSVLAGMYQGEGWKAPEPLKLDPAAQGEIES